MRKSKKDTPWSGKSEVAVWSSRASDKSFGDGTPEIL